MAATIANKFRIDVDGRPLADEVDQLVLSALVEHSLEVADVFEIVFRDPDRQVLARAGFQIGARVRLAVVSDAAPGGEPLLSGEVTAVETDYDSGGTRTIVRGYDHSHRLLRGRRTQSFENVTLSDVARQVAQDAGLEIGRIDATSEPLEHVTRANLSDWAFLRFLGRRAGCEVAAVDGRFEFRSPTPGADGPDPGTLSTDDPLQLTLGANVLRLRATLSAAGQVGEVRSRGWDPNQKQALTHAVPTTTSALDLPAARPADLAAHFGNGASVSVGARSTQAEVEAAARDGADHMARSCFQVEGVAAGNPRMRAGVAVAFGNLGSPFDGRCVLSTTRHVYDPDDGYTTAFTVGGGGLGLGATAGENPGRAPAMPGPPAPGVASAVVTDARDPQEQGRVRLQFPWLDGDYVSPWARVVYPGAGKERGLMLVPEVGDEVLVAFEQGDLSRPFVLGGLYNAIDTPAVAGMDPRIDSSNGAVNLRMLVSRQGHYLSIGDKDGNEGIKMATADDSLAISFNQTKSRARLRSSDQIEIKGDGTIVIEGGNVEIKGASVTLKASHGLQVDGGPSLELKAQTVKIEGSASVEVKSSGMGTFDGGGQAVVKGALVRIN